jgi:hypothetical protein
MDTDRFDTVTRTLVIGSSRRTALSALSIFGLGTFASVRGVPDAEARKKKKKKKPNPITPSCPPVATPAPLPFCAGKNECVAEAPCQASGPIMCFCWPRADAGHIGEPFCGQSQSTVDNCGDCSGGAVCVITGGRCGSAFLCALPCPNPL